MIDLLYEVVGDGGEFCGASHPLAQPRLAQEFRFITDRVLELGEVAASC